jgi:hypothetical protein
MNSVVRNSPELQNGSSGMWYHAQSQKHNMIVNSMAIMIIRQIEPQPQ